jgi:2'-5' RNA ligase
MRIFVALLLPNPIQEQLATFVKQLQAIPVKVKWVEKNNVHLTLSFLGERSSQEVGMIKEQLVSIRRKPFPLNTGSLLFLPNQDALRVLAVDLSVGKQEVAELGREISHVIGGKFTSVHITVGRVKQERVSKEIIWQLEQKAVPDLTFEAAEIALIQSTLTSEGPMYQVQAKIPFSL